MMEERRMTRKETNKEETGDEGEWEKKEMMKVHWSIWYLLKRQEWEERKRRYAEFIKPTVGPVSFYGSSRNAQSVRSLPFRHILLDLKGRHGHLHRRHRCLYISVLTAIHRI